MMASGVVMSDEVEACAGVDVGGTFTDVVLRAPGRRPKAVKVPTTPGDPAEGVRRGVRESLPDGTLRLLPHGSTTATNAVLEREVARTAFVTTAGFSDVLQIARQNRPALYDLSVIKPEPLVPRELVVAVEERMGPDGEPVIALTDAEIERVVAAVRRLEPESIAVSLLFSYACDDHERRLCAALAEVGVPITRSSALLPEFREFERASTCVLNAAIEPVMHRYLSGLVSRLPGPVITVMTSGGGTAGVDFAATAPVHTLLSGPAAGVVAAGAVARSAGFDDAIAFDMGGTSTDVCLIRDGRPEVSTGSEIAGLPFRTPAVGIHTVGAGGGSIAWVDAGGALRVGPRSAGADPGPACYGAGGREPTVTDAHCALGHLDPAREFGGGLRLDAEAARRALAELPEPASGVLAVVRATMARALRKVSTERGVDPAGLALVAYGGAGPLHATALARELGCPAVVVPPAPGVLSALGLLLAPPRFEASRTVLADAGDDLSQTWSELAEEAWRELEKQGVTTDISLSKVADMRYAGQSHELRVDVDGETGTAELLHAAHHEAYGYEIRDERVEVVTVRVVAQGEPVLTAPPVDWEQGSPQREHDREIGIGDQVVRARVVARAALRPGDEITGPALVEQPDTTTLLGDGEAAVVDDAENLVVRLS
ncbi:N-methylhydantoinase A [Saccharopolyspora kobensis]|uniref:N-methylhydantoinase A n=1 Tax=Saccharopolyspora kobensis TaxID=146035 RepID=A0A1H6DRE2_9PSEU|nr:hydantoinase/oxoprolinase family protein [Saccharopolyspora kobensis]SEG87912.1 N-methylhydantoinase A [Saccharopolyspora kobensis]SFE04237.1 N-methylhydantoinase A [Saccharopolyspora kobensis]